MAQPRHPGLDIVRGIAILLVLLFHFQQSLGLPWVDAALRPLFGVGWIGVDLFFVLSGFLVGRIILVEAAASGGIDRRRFFARRVLRLWPILWVYLATMVAIGGTGAWRMVWPVLLHIQNYDDQAPSHLWSLAVEEHFYLGAVLVIPALMRRGGHVLLDRVLVAILVGCLALRLAALAAGVPLLHLQWRTQYRIDAPAFGVLIASASLHRPALFAALARHRAAWFALAIGGTGILAMAGDGGFRHGIGFTLAYLAAGCAIMAALPASPSASVAASNRTGHAVAALGLIAYPVYVWHASIGVAVLAMLAGHAPSIAIFAAMLVVAIGVGAVLHRYVERPAMRLRDHPAMTTNRLKLLRTIITT